MNRSTSSLGQPKSRAAAALSAVIIGVRLVLPVGANEPPQISPLADYAINEGTHTGPRAFTVTDTETAPDQLLVRLTSSNLSLVPEADACSGTSAGFCVGGTGSNRTLDVFPVAGQSGISQISIIATDEGGLTATNSFYLTVQEAQTLVLIWGLPDHVTVAAMILSVHRPTSAARSGRAGWPVILARSS